MALKTIQAPEIGANKNAVKWAKEILTMCENGECVSFLAIVEHRDGRYQNIGSSTPNRTAMAGRLLEAAIERLGFRNDWHNGDLA